MSRYHDGIACIDCGRRCGHTVYRCRQCACREARNHHLITITQPKKEHAMRNTTTTVTPTLGDIGEEEEVEFEPLEIPTTAPVPEKVPA